MIKEADIKDYIVNAKNFHKAIIEEDEEKRDKAWIFFGKKIIEEYPVYVGNAIRELVYYSAINDLSADDVINALTALHIDVERG